MDISPLYQNKDHDQIFEFLQNHAFGLLVSQGEEHPEASHLPYSIGKEDTKWYLYSHMAMGNQHVKFLSGLQQHIFIVQGVDHYISSTWYNHENVPTWNYLSVHLKGTLEIQEGSEAVDNIKRLMDRLEPPDISSRSMEKLDPEMVSRNMSGLVAIRMNVLKVEAAKKLSQNRDQANLVRVIRELENLNNPKANMMAEEMRRNQG